MAGFTCTAVGVRQRGARVPQGTRDAGVSEAATLWLCQVTSTIQNTEKSETSHATILKRPIINVLLRPQPIRESKVQRFCGVPWRDRSTPHD